MVTALGLKREEKALGYAVTEVKGQFKCSNKVIVPICLAELTHTVV